MNFKNKSSGFMLLELTIALGIISLILAGGLAMMRVHSAGKPMRETHERISVVKGAMSAFMTINGRLPCPASLTAAPGSANFGIEDSTTCALTTPPSKGTVRVANPKANKGGVRIGAVPFVTLGISVQNSMDGWNGRFLYAVSEALANEGIPYDEKNGAITVLDSGTTASGPNPHHTPFVLISFGPSGHGAYTYEGLPRAGAACAATGPQRENCDMSNAVFRNMPYSTSESDATRFDNILTNDLFAQNPVRICGDQGMLYGPGHSRADPNGCVPDMVEAASGNVGIGTTAPVARLDVQGEVKIGNSGAPCTNLLAGATRNNPATNLIEHCSATAGPGGTPAWIPLMPVSQVNGDLGFLGNFCSPGALCNPRPATAHFRHGGNCTPQERGMAKLMIAGTASDAGQSINTDGIFFCLCGTTSFSATIECAWLGMQSTPNDGAP